MGGGRREKEKKIETRRVIIVVENRVLHGLLVCNRFFSTSAEKSRINRDKKRAQWVGKCALF